MTELNPAHGKVVALALATGDLITDNADIEENAEFYRIVINLGSEDEVKSGTRFLVFSLGKELTDPESGDNLGAFEIVKGVGKVTNLQVRMATLTSERTKTIQRPKNALAALSNISNYLNDTVSVEVSAPFLRPRVGDLVRLV